MMKNIEKELIKSLSTNIKNVPMISKELKYPQDHIRKILRIMRIKGIVKMYSKNRIINLWYLTKKGKKLLKNINFN